MKNSKFKIEKLKVNSFITKLDEEKQNTVKGGSEGGLTAASFCGCWGEK